MRHESGAESLTTHCTIHDRSQFEVQFNYGISAEHTAQGKDVEHYRVEAFYFFPTNMGITALNFPRESFYRSLYAYIRFKTPDISELNLLDPLSRQSPLNVLSFHLKRLSMGQPVDDESASNEARLFGCIVSSLLRQRAKELEGLMERVKQQHGDGLAWRELEGSVGDFLAEVPELLAKYRGLVDDYRTFESRLSSTLLDRLRQVDEFLTYRLDHTLSALHFAMLSTWEAPARLSGLADRLHAVAEAESIYRTRRGFITLSPGDDEALALYTYRSGALKKLIDQVLYLDVKTIQENNRWRNLAAGLGALGAAFFAGISDRTYVFPLYQQNLYLAISLFAIIYVAKDRLKEFMREYVWEHMSRFFPDNKLLIHDPTKNINVGRCREKVRYMPKQVVPEDVLKVRNAHHSIDLDSERKETVILYQNDLKLKSGVILSEHQRRTDIKHILRFSVEDLLSRLDNPTARVQFYDPASQIFCRVRAPKVYHLNVVFRLSRWDERNRLEAPHFHRIRVILDKNGIHHIETVADGHAPHDASALTRVSKQQGPLRQEEENLF